MNDISISSKTAYEIKNKISFDNLAERQFEVYEKVPEIRDIDDRIALAGIRYNKMILKDSEIAEELIIKLNDDIKNLNSKKESLLIDNGYPKNYLDKVFLCNQCKDTGFLLKEDGLPGIQRCACYKQKLIDKLYSQSNIQIIKDSNFSMFNENYFSDEINEPKYGLKISPRRNILNIKDRCLKFIEDFDSPEEKNLFFNGSTGVGKTFMSNCIAVKLMDMGRTVLYQTAPMLFDTINQYKFKSFKDEYHRDLAYEKILNVELLIIDDLGTETTSAARYAELLTILNTRQTNNLKRACKTIISTNMGAKELYENYTERVASRIIGSFDMFKFAGEDIRILKKLEK